MTTDAASASPKKKNIWAIFAIVAVVSIVLAWGLLFKSGLDKAMVRQKLDEYAAMLQEKGRAQGRDISLTYSDLEITGGLTSRHAVVHNPSLAIKPIEGQSTAESIVITTPELLIYPESRNLSSLRFSLPAPVNFATPEEPEKSLLKITAATPVEVTLTQHEQDKVPYTKISHKAPESIDFTYLREKKAEGVEDATPEIVPVYDTIHMAIAPGSSFETDFAMNDSNYGRVDVAYGKITTTPQSAPEGVITVAGINAHWSYGLNAQKVPVMEDKIHVGPITSTPDVLPHAPLELTLDGSYQGMAPAAEAGKEQGAAISLRKFELSTKESTLSATADFTANGGDVLPVGKAHIKLTNTPFVREQLHKYDLLTTENEEWVGKLIQQVTGTAFDQIKDIELPIERTRGGAFKIGNSTFEEVFATVLKQALKAKLPGGESKDKKAPAPALPDKDKPKAAPIAIPDNGVRG